MLTCLAHLLFDYKYWRSPTQFLRLLEAMDKARFVGLFFFLLLLLLASQGMVEARHCESQSHRFKGMCVSHHNCASVCRVEGFTGGKCRGARRRCFCNKVC